MRLSTLALVALFGWGCGSKSDDQSNDDAATDADGGGDVGDPADTDEGPPPEDSGTPPADDPGTPPADDTASSEDTGSSDDTGESGDDTGEDIGPDYDGDGVADALDCNDTDPDIYPGADELCDGIDNDCDGDVDEVGATDADTWYADTDGDGWGRESVTVLACEAPEGFVSTWGDCDDHSALALPGGTEVCDGLDNDCDGDVDEGDASDATVFYADTDGDGFGDSAAPTPLCSLMDGYTTDSTDCDDTEALKYPGATESCDGLDNDCDGTVDEEDAVDVGTWYQDDDGDGYGQSDSSLISCDMPAGYSAAMGDCDDGNPDISPVAVEVCDEVDNDCNGVVDVGSVDAEVWYLDADGDSYGLATASTSSCNPPEGYVEDATDCNDDSAAAHPGLEEVCDGLDNNCDGVTDDLTAIDVPTWYRDLDADGYGDPSRSVIQCDAPAVHVGNDLDCNDYDAEINPDADEVCDDADNDCDGTIDGPDSIDAVMSYVDLDADGFGDESSGEMVCALPSGSATVGGDCDDSDDAVGSSVDDADCDGVPTVDDCDDGDASIGSSVSDLDCDGIPAGEDCDDTDASAGSSVDDADCDGLPITLDCDDSDASIGSAALDLDCDGFSAIIDCDDMDASVGSIIDDADCDGVPTVDDCDDGDETVGSSIFDLDCDGIPTGDDCDDTDATIGLCP